MRHATDIKINVGRIQIHMKPPEGIGLFDVYAAIKAGGVRFDGAWSMDSSGNVQGEVEDVLIHFTRRKGDIAEPGAAVIIALQGIGCNTVSVSELTKV